MGSRGGSGGSGGGGDGGNDLDALTKKGGGGNAAQVIYNTMSDVRHHWCRARDLQDYMLTSTPLYL